MEQEKIQVNLSRSAGGGGGASQEGTKTEEDMDGSHDGGVMPAATATTREE